MAGYNGWWNSIENFLTKFQQPEVPKKRKPGRPPPTPKPIAPVIQSALSLDEKMQIIAKAAASTTLVFMKYNNTWRYAEPYSYRFKGQGRLLYAFCYKDQHIESFNPEKIEDVQNTEMPFSPRWPVEISLG